MTTVYEIPLTPQAQNFSITLAGVDYQMMVKWCDPGSEWVLDIFDGQGNALLRGVPLVTGADLLEQYAHMGFGGKLIVQTDSDIHAMPTYDNLGAASHLYFVVS